MATTTIEVNMSPYFTPATAVLVAAETGIVAASATPRNLTASGWRFTFTATEALVGIYRVNVLDGDAIQVAVFWVWIEADSAVTYIADSDFGTAFLKRINVELKNLEESDDRLEQPVDVVLLKRYQRQTSDLLIPPKTALQIDGSPLTDITTQRLAGFQEE